MAAPPPLGSGGRGTARPALEPRPERDAGTGRGPRLGWRPRLRRHHRPAERPDDRYGNGPGYGDRSDDRRPGHDGDRAGARLPSDPRQDPGGAAPETSSGLVGELTAAVPALEDPATATAPVDHLLQDRIRAGGLPLPGQGKAVPDAFAIASVLQPSAPAAPHDGEPRASRDVGVEGADQAEPPGRSGGSGTSGRSEVSGLPALPVPAGTASPDALPVPPTTARSAADRAPAAVNAGTPLVPAQRRPPPAAGVRAEAAAPVAAAGTGAGAAVLVPIAAGLLLTGAAMYKHRGLPRGH